MPFEGLFSFAWPTRVTVETIKLYLIVNYSVRFITPVDNCINLQLWSNEMLLLTALGGFTFKSFTLSFKTESVELMQTIDFWAKDYQSFWLDDILWY